MPSVVSVTRIVADTNIVVSGLFWQGAPRQILDLARKQTVVLCSSPVLLDELADVIARAKFQRRLEAVSLSAAELMLNYARITEIVDVPEQAVSRVVASDPDDDHVIACAVIAHADMIVSGDQHLFSLREHQGIPILSASEALHRIGGSG